MNSNERPKVVGNFFRVSNETMRRNGRLFIFFVGAGYCPFCAVERWAIVRALQRFGEWVGLEPSRSASKDEAFLNVPTYDLTKAKYTSDLIQFVGRETDDREFHPLQKLTEEETGLVHKFNPDECIPFLLIAGRYMQIGSGISPKLFVGHSFDQIQELTDTESEIGNAVKSEMNVITALLCLSGLQSSFCEESDILKLITQANVRSP